MALHYACHIRAVAGAIENCTMSRHCLSAGLFAFCGAPLLSSPSDVGAEHFAALMIADACAFVQQKLHPLALKKMNY